MKSINFPNMFKSTSATEILTDKTATLNNLKLLLNSEKGELSGDPFYGIRLKRYLFEQNNKILKDIIIDEIYTQISVFMPQLIIKRKDIDVIQTNRGTLVANIKVTNKVDYTVDSYSLVLFNGGER